LKRSSIGCESDAASRQTESAESLSYRDRNSSSIGGYAATVSIVAGSLLRTSLFISTFLLGYRRERMQSAAPDETDVSWFNRRHFN
jgi:hypothetical protein